MVNYEAEGVIWADAPESTYQSDAGTSWVLHLAEKACANCASIYGLRDAK